MHILGIALVILTLTVPWALLRDRAKLWCHTALAVGFLPFPIGFLSLDAAQITLSLWPGHSFILMGLVIAALPILIAEKSNGRLASLVGIAVTSRNENALLSAFMQSHTRGRAPDNRTARVGNVVSQAFRSALRQTSKGAITYQ